MGIAVKLKKTQVLKQFWQLQAGRKSDDVQEIFLNIQRN